MTHDANDAQSQKMLKTYYFYALQVTTVKHNYTKKQAGRQTGMCVPWLSNGYSYRSQYSRLIPVVVFNLEFVHLLQLSLSTH